MIISLELDQSWGTAKETLEYLKLLSKTLERIVELGEDAPMDWYLAIEDDKMKETYTIKLTHL